MDASPAEHLHRFLLYSHGFARVAAAVPHVRVADPEFNASARSSSPGRPRRAAPRSSSSPSSGCRATRSTTCSTSRRCSTRCSSALRAIVAGSRELAPVIVVGAPLRGRARAVQRRGRDPPRPRARRRPQELPARVPRVLREAPVPRGARRRSATEIAAARRGRAVRPRPAVREPRPRRASSSTSRSARTCGCRSRRAPTARWPARPCSRTCRRATSRSARPTTAARCARRSRRARSPRYVYTAAGLGESTTDLAWDGQALIYENGDLLAEAERFADEEQLIFADIDLDRILADRLEHEQLRRLDPRPPPRPGADAADRVRARRCASRPAALRRRDRALPVRARRPGQPQRALRGGLQHPGPRARDAAARDRDREGRDRRLRRPGLDARADRRGPRRSTGSGLPRANVLAYTMPGFATSELTLGNAHELMRGARGQRRRDRHPPRGDADAPRPRPPGRRRRARLRRHLRERAGRRADLAPVPAGQLPRRAGARHRRPLRARAGLVAPTASATRCRTTTSMPRCPRR